MPRRNRWTAEKRGEFVMELLKGKAPTTQIARKHQVSDALMDRWRQRFYEAGMAALNFEDGTASSQYREQALEQRIEELEKVIGLMHRLSQRLDVRILLADCQDVCRRGLRSLLASHSGWSICDEAKNGSEAVRLTLALKPDIVILDLDLLELNGIEATRQIKREQPLTEVLLYTTHDEEQIIAEALRAGVRGHVLKSDSEEKLTEAVAALSKHLPFFSTRAAETLLDHMLKAGQESTETHPLTARELEIVQLLTDAKSNRDIASHLHISVKTVEAHRSAIMHKLGLKSITELVRYAIRNRFIQP